MHFSYNNIKFKKHKTENWLVAEGEITNESGKSYQTVVFRLVVFIKEVPVGNVTFIIHNFRPGQTKFFEKQMGELTYKIIPEISRYEIYPESAY